MTDWFDNNVDEVDSKLIDALRRDDQAQMMASALEKYKEAGVPAAMIDTMRGKLNERMAEIQKQALLN